MGLPAAVPARHPPWRRHRRHPPGSVLQPADAARGGDWQRLSTATYAESGGLAALQGRRVRTSSFSTTLGLRLSHAFETAWGRGRVQLSTGWRHAYGNVLPTMRTSFSGGRDFELRGAPLARDAALVGLDGSLRLRGGISPSLSYQGQYAAGLRDHAGTLRASWQF